jgi:VanZ family protein
MSMGTFILDQPRPRWQKALRFIPAIAIMSVIFHISHQQKPGRDAMVKAMSPVARSGKVLHALGYAGLGVAFSWAYAGVVRRLWLVAGASWASASAYAAFDELHQAFVKGRTGAVRDVAIDSLGALVACAVVVSVVLLWKRLAVKRGFENGSERMGSGHR